MKALLGSVLFSMGVSALPAAPPDAVPPRQMTREESQQQAERLVRQMRGRSMQTSPGAPSSAANGRFAPEDQFKEDLVTKLAALGKPAVTALAQALRDPEMQMRRNVALVLIKLGGGYYYQEVGRNGGLGPKINIREALPALLRVMEDQDESVRAWAAQAVGCIGPEAKETVPVLIKLLHDPDEGARNSSCIALRDIGPAARSALPDLRKALQDPAKDVRRFAQNAIAAVEK